MEKTCVIVMMRYPRTGRVKTRLAADIGERNAFRLYLNFLKDTIINIASDDLDIILSILEPEKDTRILEELGDWDQMIRQKGKDLGQRQFNSLNHAFEMGYDISMVVSGDCPEISGSTIFDAMKVLSKKDTVLGPCQDGGYYLFGTRKDKLRPEIFEDISWGSENVSRKLGMNLEDLGSSNGTIGELNDLDDLEDVVNFYRRRSGIGPGHTLALLKELIDEGAILIEP